MEPLRLIYPTILSLAILLYPLSENLPSRGIKASTPLCPK
jgi:hypothetical protein